jgi:hypothetical protein
LGAPVGVFDAGLDPVGVTGADEDPCLVELPGERGGELDPDRAVRLEGSQEGVLAVVDEPVGGRAPGVAAFLRGDEEIGAVFSRGDGGWVQ